MAHYAITAVKWNQRHTAVEEAVVHRMTGSIDARDCLMFGLDTGVFIKTTLIAYRIAVEGDSFVLVMYDNENFAVQGDRVRVKPGREGEIETVGSEGFPTWSLERLPVYT